MTILLFGASGRLGSAIMRVLSHHIFLTPSGQEVDLTNAEAVETYIASHPANLIVNCAAYNDTKGAEEHPDLANALNGTAPGIIAKAAAQQEIPVIHFSTNYVFDGEKVEGYQESDTPNPQSAYARSKYLGEIETLKNNPRSYVIRTSRLYGPAGAEMGKKSFLEIVIDLAKEKTTFDINDGEISAPTLVDDIARHLGTHIFTLPAPGVYHISNAGGCTWFEWARSITEILKLRVEVTPRDPWANVETIKKPAHSILLSTKIPPMRPWKEALEDYLLHQYVG